MTPKPSGWYDDPHDPTQLRYWDGILWSDRTMPKVAPGLEHVGEARPESELPHTPAAGRGEPAREYPAHWGPETFDRNRAPHVDGAPHLPHLAHTSHPHPTSRASVRQGNAATPAGLGRRILSAMIDWFLVLFLSSLFMPLLLSGQVDTLKAFNESQMQSIQNGAQPPAVGSDVIQAYFAVFGFLTLLLIAYDFIATQTSGRTLGRLAAGTRVVPRTGDTKSPVRVLLRSIVKWAPAILGFAGLPLAALTLLAGLSNTARQGLHDKAGGTQVTNRPPSRQV